MQDSDSFCDSDSSDLDFSDLDSSWDLDFACDSNSSFDEDCEICDGRVETTYDPTSGTTGLCTYGR